MLVTIEGFGSIWSKRTRSDPENPKRERVAYYNTTGICLDGRMRHRSRIFGQLRFNGRGGFIAKGVERNIGRVFQCSAEMRQGSVAKLTFHHLTNKPKPPDYFLFAVTSDHNGLVSIESEGWKSESVFLLSFSEFKSIQEAILLMRPYSWIRGSIGTFMADPNRDRPWRAQLRLLG
jgi:hypothetical protein